MMWKYTNKINFNWDERFAVYTNIEPLCYTPVTNVMYVNITSIKTKSVSAEDNKKIFNFILFELNKPKAKPNKLLNFRVMFLQFKRYLFLKHSSNVKKNKHISILENIIDSQLWIYSLLLSSFYLHILLFNFIYLSFVTFTGFFFSFLNSNSSSLCCMFKWIQCFSLGLLLQLLSGSIFYFCFFLVWLDFIMGYFFKKSL